MSSTGAPRANIRPPNAATEENGAAIHIARQRGPTNLRGRTLQDRATLLERARAVAAVPQASEVDFPKRVSISLKDGDPELWNTAAEVFGLPTLIPPNTNAAELVRGVFRASLNLFLERESLLEKVATKEGELRALRVENEALRSALPVKLGLRDGVHNP